MKEFVGSTLAPLGCVLAIRNRPPRTLLRTLETFVYQELRPCDRVLLDYGSTLRFAHEYEKLCARFDWRYHRCLPQGSAWNLSDAYNRAVFELDSTAEVVFKSDVDVLLGAGVLEKALASGNDKLALFPCWAAEAHVHYPVNFSAPEQLLECFASHPIPQSMPGEGIHAFPRAWFNEIGGYDRRLNGWGFEDSDLRLRASRSIGVTHVSDVKLLHQWHPSYPSSRATERNEGIYQRSKQQRSIIRNRRQLIAPRPKRIEPRCDEANVEQHVDFIIKSFLRPKAVERLLDSIRTFYPLAHVTIGDDGGLTRSQDVDSRRLVARICADEWTTLIDEPFRLGPSEGRNVLVDNTSRPFLLLLDDDFCFTEDTKIEVMLARLIKDPQLGVVGGRCYDCDGRTRQERRFAGSLAVRDRAIRHTIGEFHSSESKACDIVLHFALFRRGVFFDARWTGGPGGHHYDFFLQLQQSPWRVVQEDSVSIDHYPWSEALPGYRACRNQVLPGQRALLSAWHADRLQVNGQTIFELADGRTRLNDTNDADVGAPRCTVRFTNWTIGPFCWLFLKSLLQAKMRTLECGSGLSTQLFAAAGCDHIALEHDVAHAARLPQVKLCDLAGDPPWYEWCPEEAFDVILVDGPPVTIGRSGIRRVIGQCLKPSTILVIDDVHRAADLNLAEELARDFKFTISVFDDLLKKKWAVLHREPLRVPQPAPTTAALLRQ